MAVSLEDKIKSLLESKGELQEAVLVTATEGEDVQIVDGSNMTQFAQDQMAMQNVQPDQAKVNEDVQVQGEEDGNDKTAKIQQGMGQADPAPSALGDIAQPDPQDPQAAADNQKIQAGKASQDPAMQALQSWMDDDANGFKQTNQSTGLNEHMSALFSGENLSEEFKQKAEAIFEAAVNAVAEERVAALEEEYQVKLEEATMAIQEELDEAVENVTEELVNNIDGFLNHVVEQWVADNQLAIESGLQVEMTNSFIDGLKTLFREHYVEVPDSKIDVVEEQKSEIEQLTKTAEELSEAKASLEAELSSIKSKLVFENVSRGLTGVQKDKFRTLVEGVEFTDELQYSTKLETIKESYFSNKVSAPVEDTQVQTIVESNDVMNKYVGAISKNLKFI